jgi:hypothetical protein
MCVSCRRGSGAPKGVLDGMCDILLNPEEKKAALRGSRNVETLGERSDTVEACNERARRTLKRMGAYSYLFKGLAGFLKKSQADPDGATRSKPSMLSSA